MGLVIYPRGPRIPTPLIETYNRLSPATVGHYLEFGFMDPGIRSIQKRVKVVGPAFTIRCPAQDSAAVHVAMGLVEPGDVVVIDRCGDDRHACVGEIVALAAKYRKVAGIIVDGPITDVREVENIGVPVFCRGTSALTTKIMEVEGEINGIVQCGGVVAAPGDLIVADDNGVLVLKPEKAQAIVEQIETDEREEVGLRESLAKGVLLPFLTGLRQYLDSSWNSSQDE